MERIGGGANKKKQLNNTLYAYAYTHFEYVDMPNYPAFSSLLLHEGECREKVEEFRRLGYTVKKKHIGF